MNVTKIADLKNVPLEISVALGDASTAQGNIFIEEGYLKLQEYENYQIVANQKQIVFFNESARTQIYSNISQIASITVSFLQQNQYANASCAYMLDGSKQALYVSTYYFETRGQIKIVPKFLPDPGQPDYLDLNNLVKINYGIAQAGNETDLCP